MAGSPYSKTADRSSEVRLFLSSTFRDLQPEREYLIKHVVPELRIRFRECGIELTEIDLRWGITNEETVGGRTVRLCLEEVDRCRPYFIGIMAERHGWAPTSADVVAD